ncbi:MAG: polyphosphate polymerase domain-containing protein [Lachnospiraceae bacterium]|nr:polyphosphate polymerase domain-containing protein [Lachnospiraceae bacterium]
MAQEIFRRYEKKYKITREQYQELLGRMITRLSPEPYGKHTICNIYFDTEDFQMIQHSLEKPCYKEKLRLRSYGTPKETDLVYVELKKKFDGIVYKRRVPMRYKEAKKYLYNGIRPNMDSQILREIDYTLDFYQARPAVYLAYDRLAFYGKDNPDFRITFDMNIRARQHVLELDKGVYGTLLMPWEMLLMEVKIPGAMPLWMSRILSELDIYPTSYSKYGTYYQNYIEESTEKDFKEKGVEICA